MTPAPAIGLLLRQRHRDRGRVGVRGSSCCIHSDADDPAEDDVSPGHVLECRFQNTRACAPTILRARHIDVGRALLDEQSVGRRFDDAELYVLALQYASGSGGVRIDRDGLVGALDDARAGPEQDGARREREDGRSHIHIRSPLCESRPGGCRARRQPIITAGRNPARTRAARQRPSHDASGNGRSVRAYRRGVNRWRTAR